MGHELIKSLCTSSSATQMDMLKKLMEIGIKNMEPNQRSY